MYTKNIYLSAEEFKEIFEKEVKINMLVTSKDKKEKIVVGKDEEWRQCYKQNDENREELPKYWFYSDRGNLISVLSGKPYLIKKISKNKKNIGRDRYHYHVDINGVKKSKCIFCTRLTFLVFGTKAYGKAEEEYNKYGIDALIEGFLNLHHIWEKSNNSPEFLQLLKVIVHRLITKAQRTKVNIENVLAEFCKIACEEEPYKISVLFPGHKVDKNTLEMINDNEIKYIDTLDSQDNIKFATEQALGKLKSICIILSATDLLFENYGVDFFENTRYLVTRDKEYLFYKCEQVENELVITEVNKLSELANKDYILCCLNEDNKVECYIDNIENVQKVEVDEYEL